MMKIFNRLADIMLSMIGIIIILPIIPIIGLFIKLDSKGPVFFLVDRVGQNMKIFKMFKFRTMLEFPNIMGESVCAQHDPRVTTFGRLLRRTKLNELPQLINVLLGDMTIVGPRPEAPDLAILYPEEAKKIFTVKPGIVSPATIWGRNEEEFYPPGVDTKKYYIESILPEKLKLDLQYIDNKGFFNDLFFIFSGIKETIFGALNKKHINDNASQIYLMISDIFLMTCSFSISYFLCFLEYNLSELNYFFIIIKFFFIAIPIKFIGNIYFGLYSSLIRYISFNDIKKVIISGISSSIILIIIFNIVYTHRILYVLIIDLLFYITFLSFLRITAKLIWLKKYNKVSITKKKRILIYGACDEGNSACELLKKKNNHEYEVIGFIDDSPKKYGKAVNGIKVLGNYHHLNTLINIYKINEIIIAEPKLSNDVLNKLYEICKNCDIEIKYFYMINNIHLSYDRNLVPRNLEFSDLLPLKKVATNYKELKNILPEKSILIFGTASSFGLELCKNLIRIGCKKLIIVDRYESYLNELLSVLSKEFFINKIVPYLFESFDVEKLDNIFEIYKPDIVIHAGMRKYESPFGINCVQAFNSNYTQTFNLANLAKKYETSYFFLISSIFNNHISSIIQESLKVSETALKYFFEDQKTKYGIIRFSEIIENRGGIVSSIKEQINKQKKVILPSTLNNGPIMLTSKYSATQFFMNTMNKIICNSTNANEYECGYYFSAEVIDIIKKISFFSGIKNWQSIDVEFISNTKNYYEITEKRSDAKRNYLLDIISNKQTEKRQLFNKFISNELSKNKKEYFRTKDLLELC